jgi:reversibly glycosylated polypeptide/UDP-arabinopyranose mutase
LTLDDDVTPIGKSDPIQEHLDVLQKKVPLGWMNTAHGDSSYLRGVPYGIRKEAPVMLSHGVWVGIPDFDGETQLELEAKTGDIPYTKPDGTPTKGPAGIPYSLPYYVGPIPIGVLFPLCGMNVMVRRQALPYLYFAPMGPDTKIVQEREVDQTSGGTHTFTIPLLNRFADIWMGISLKKQFDRLGWACYTGGATILHTRASDAKKNFEQEKLGREWNEDADKYIDNVPDNAQGTKSEYFSVYHNKKVQFATLIENILFRHKYK